MTKSPPTLHLFCGKMASGKSSLAARIAKEESAVSIAEDEWLAVLFEDQLHDPKDYVQCSKKLRAICGPHVVSLLGAGVSVVLDFHGNTVEARDWMRGILLATNAEHKLHVLMTSDAICLERLRSRNLGEEHPFAPTEEQFHLFSKYFVAPTEDEGFTLEIHE